jgi:hypothetical protein
VRGDGIEGGDVVEAELAQGRLEDFDSRGGCSGVGGDGVGERVGGGCVDRFDDFVDRGGDEGVCVVSISDAMGKAETCLAIRGDTTSAHWPQSGSHTAPTRLSVSLRRC